MRHLKTILAAGAIAAAIAYPAIAIDISGAGATFPYPVYAKWADAYKKGDRQRAELPVDRLRRRHQADHRPDRDLRRLRHAAEAGRTREDRRHPVPDRDGRRGAGDQPRRHQERRHHARRPDARQDLHGRGQDLGRSGDRQAQPEGQAAEAGDRGRAPLRRIGHHLHLHQLSLEGECGLEVEGRQQHRGGVAGRHRRQGQRRRRQ